MGVPLLAGWYRIPALTVYDIDQARMWAWLSRGHWPAESSRQTIADGAEMVLTCLPTSRTSVASLSRDGLIDRPFCRKPPCGLYEWRPGDDSRARGQLAERGVRICGRRGERRTAGGRSGINRDPGRW